MNEREKEKERKKKQKNEYIFPLNFSGVPCVSSRAAPREFNSIFNLPKPPYANSVLEYLWTTLFSLLVAAFPYLTSLSASTAFISSRFLESPLRADFLPSYSGSPSEKRRIPSSSFSNLFSLLSNSFHLPPRFTTEVSFLSSFSRQS